MASTNPEPSADAGETPRKLPFPPVTRSHILHCSYHYWQPLYRAITPKARLIPLSDAFLSYLRSDGIVLPPENHRVASSDDSGIDTFSDDETHEGVDPSTEWQDIHQKIKDTIRELDGKVAPKLNWSAPKDATWISATNDMKCRTPNDIYLLLKSSDFVTHDLEHPFDDTVPDSEVTGDGSSKPDVDTTKVPYHLVLRKYFNLNPSLEFRCFVRDRLLLCMCQRDLNHFDFLFPMRDSLRERIQTFFDEKLKNTFPDPNFVFDVYIPPPHDRVWLIDINPWAVRTDPLLFSWLEILTMEVPSDKVEEDVARLSLNGDNKSPDDKGDEKDEPVEVVPWQPELRLVKRDDPEAYAFSTPQYSAHKLPREVVDASKIGPSAMKEFMDQWQDILNRQRQEDTDSSEDEA
ncbi:hypothetical protein VTN49DRAFT_2468 [Thermomyces lanuginosus]|uniref:uncharacterized protein n=1 Tax=Thermomyces lanuginosus TaxID=5541 RepID=UPI003743D16C